MTTPTDTARQAAERYIVYTGEEYMDFDTESESIAQAERDIKGWRDLARSDCEWSEEVERVAVFRMIAFAEQTVSQNDYGTEECDYSLSAINTETAALQAENERLRERYESLEAENKTLTVASKSVASIGNARLDKLEQLTAERDTLRKKTIDLEGMLATAHEAASNAIDERDELRELLADCRDGSNIDNGFIDESTRRAIIELIGDGCEEGGDTGETMRQRLRRATAERDEAREELEPLNLARQFKPDPHTIGAQDEKTILAVRVLNYLDMTLADELDEEVAAIQKQLRRVVAESDEANQRAERAEKKLKDLQAKCIETGWFDKPKEA